MLESTPAHDLYIATTTSSAAMTCTAGLGTEKVTFVNFCWNDESSVARICGTLMGGGTTGGVNVNEATATSLVPMNPATVTVHWIATPGAPAPVSGGQPK